MEEISDKFLIDAIESLEPMQIDALHTGMLHSFKVIKPEMSEEEVSETEFMYKIYVALLELFSQHIMQEQDADGFPKFREFAAKYGFKRNVSVGDVIDSYIEKAYNKIVRNQVSQV